MLHVHVLPESPATKPYSVCAEVRLINPFSHPSIRNRVRMTLGFDSTLPGGRTDVVVLQRNGYPGLDVTGAADLVRAIRAAGAKIVYDIDDDLLLPHPVLKVESNLRKLRPVGRFLAREADLIICSTPTLQDRFSAFEAPRAVWPNAIDDRMLLENGPPRAPTAAGPVVVGYAGTPTHLPDLLSVTEGLRHMLAARPDTVSLDFLGVAPKDRLAALFGDRLAAAPRDAMGYRDFFRLMQKRSGWDIAIAPLDDNAFNRAKSDIKFLEYAVFGVPGVYSRCNAYQTVRHRDTGLVADRESFADALAELLDSPALRRSIADSARDHVRSERTLDKRAGDLLDLVESVL